MAAATIPPTNKQAAKFLPWYKRWLQMRREVPVAFNIRVPSTIIESSRVTVEVFVENLNHETNKRLSKLPDYLIRGALTSSEVDELVPLLSMIRGVTGCKLHNSVALLATFQVLVMDSYVARESIGISDMSAAFFGAFSPSAAEKKNAEGSFHPVFSPREITAEWTSAFLPFLKVYTLDPSDRTPALFYATIPPFTIDGVIPLEQLRESDLMSDAELQREMETLQNEQRVTVNKLKSVSATVRGLTKYNATCPSREVMFDLAEANRFKSSGKINYAAVGKKLRRDPKTAKAWLESYSIR